MNNPRKEKLAELESKIESARRFLAQPGEVTPQQLQIVYREIMELSNQLEVLKMNKFDSPHFQYIPSETYSRSQRKKMLKAQAKGKPRY
jgi:hypothetical protein